MCGLSDLFCEPPHSFGEAPFAQFVSVLLLWFEEHARDLPWRREYTPYGVWIAEVMLSQTQVARVVSYYERFLKRFPDVASLASASQEEVFLLWEGLGYYRRALDLHKAAQVISQEFGGTIPRDYVSLRKLPGVGPYIASAILAIGYNDPVLALEANGRRVLARFFGLSREHIPQEVVEHLASCIPQGKARLVNQAIMDFGALVCTPRNPKCSPCPLREDCVSCGREGSVGKAQKRILKNLRVALCFEDEMVLLEKSAGRLFAELFVFPWGEDTGDPKTWMEELGKRYDFTPENLHFVGAFTHAYTRYKVYVRVFRVLVRRQGEEGVWVPKGKLSKYPFPSLFRKALCLAFPGEYPL